VAKACSEHSFQKERRIAERALAGMSSAERGLRVCCLAGYCPSKECFYCSHGDDYSGKAREEAGSWMPTRDKALVETVPIARRVSTPWAYGVPLLLCARLGVCCLLLVKGIASRVAHAFFGARVGGCVSL
jgi:hypothetical protein